MIWLKFPVSAFRRWSYIWRMAREPATKTAFHYLQGLQFALLPSCVMPAPSKLASPPYVQKRKVPAPVQQSLLQGGVLDRQAYPISAIQLYQARLSSLVAAVRGEACPPYNGHGHLAKMGPFLALLCCKFTKYSQKCVKPDLGRSQ